jgi:hypothetical protein
LPSWCLTLYTLVSILVFIDRLVKSSRQRYNLNQPHYWINKQVRPSWHFLKKKHDALTLKNKHLIKRQTLSKSRVSGQIPLEIYVLTHLIRLYFLQNGGTRPSLWIDWCMRLFIDLFSVESYKRLHHGSHTVDKWINQIKTRDKLQWRCTSMLTEDQNANCIGCINPIQPSLAGCI